MQAHSGTITLSEWLRRARVDCKRPECTESCAYRLSCYDQRAGWIFVGIWLAVVLAVLSALVAIV